MSPETILTAAGLLFVVVSLLVFVAWAFDRYAPDRLVQERHDLSVGTILLVPFLFVLSLRPGRSDLSATAEAGVIPAETPITAIDTPTSIAHPAFVVEPAHVSFDVPWGPALLAIWCVVSLALLVRLGRDLWATARLKANTRPVSFVQDMPLSRTITIRQSADIDSPMLVGCFRPFILLPERSGPETVTRGVLEHEIAHAVRKDLWITLALRFLSAVFWWLLPLRLLSPIINRSREMLCDSYAAEMTGDPKELATALLDTAVRMRKAPVPALMAAGHGSDLPGRVRRLAATQAWRKRKAWATLTTLLPALVLAAFVATPRLGEAHAQGNDRTGFLWIDNGNDADLPLYRAAYRGDINEVRRLIAEGDDPSAVSPGDGTPLMAAIRGRREALLDVLLEAGADPNRVAPGDGTALIYAARAGEVSMTEKLLQANADPNLGVDGDGNPLIVSASNGSVRVMDILLAAGADPNAAVPGDGNPLIAAAQRGRLAAAKRLLDAGADPNGYVYRDETPLVAAAQQGHLDVLNLLIAAGADISLTVETPHHDPGGPYRSPLSEAERNGHDAVVRRLRELGAQHSPPE